MVYACMQLIWEHNPFTYLVPESYDAMRIVHECREAGLPCYFTMDAGPNVKVLIEKKNQQAIVDKFYKNLINHKSSQVTLPNQESK